MRHPLNALLIALLIAATGGAHAEAFRPPAEAAWSFDARAAANGGPVAGPGRVYVGGDDAAVYAVNIDTGAPMWRAAVGSRVTSALAAHGERVYAGTEAGHLVCIRPPLLREGIVGVEEWRFLAGGAINTVPIVTPAGRVVFGADDGFVYALDRQGRIVWQYRASSRPVGEIALYREPYTLRDNRRVRLGDALVYCTSRDGVVHAMRELDGKALWSYATGSPAHAGPCVADTLVIAGNEDGKVVALHPKSGRPAWTLNVRGAVMAAPSQVDGRVYVACESGSVSAINLNSGKVIWETRLCGPIVSSSVPTVGGYLLVTCRAGMVYALRRSDGRTVWGKNVDETVTAGASLIGSRLVLATADGKVHAFAPGGKWQVDAPPSILDADEPASDPMPGEQLAAACPAPSELAPAMPASTEPAPADFPSPVAHDTPVTAIPVATGSVTLLTETDDPAQPAIQIARGECVTISGRAPEGAVQARLNDVPIDLAGGRFHTVAKFSGAGTYPVTLEFSHADGRRTFERRVVVVNPSERPASSVPAFISPDRDGSGQSMRFTFRPAEVDEPSVSVLTIRDESGAAIREWANVTSEETSFEWNGRDQWGRLVSDGQYVAVYTLRGVERGETLSLYQPLIVDNTGM